MQHSSPASPYSTGGGGVTLEHLYGATVLAALLTGDPYPSLGDEQTVVKVAFQARALSPVDDLLVFGEPRPVATGEPRRVAVGVRRDPTMAAGDAEFVKLLSSYLQALKSSPLEHEHDRARLALVVAGPHTGAGEVRRLTEIARTHATSDVFRATVMTPGSCPRRVQRRLRLLDEAVTAAARGGLTEWQSGQDVTWRLLRSLSVIETWIETDDAKDRTHCVARLRSVSGEASDADRLFGILCALSAKYAATGAQIDEATLRRDLVGRACVERSPSLRQATHVLDRLGDLLSQHTRSALRVNSGEGREPQNIVVDRHAIRDQLVQRIELLSAAPGALVLTGEPDVGKSALALAAAAAMRERGAIVLAFSLQDVHKRPIDLEAVLETTLYRAFGVTAVAPIRVLIVDGVEAVLAGRSDTFREIALAAVRTGLTVVAVTRSDGSRRTLEMLQEAVRAVLPSGQVEQFDVPSLDDRELEGILEKSPPLRRISSNERARWLLRRLGLLDALLRADAVAGLPDGALSEADIFSVIWSRWVRRGEVSRPGEATPDGREAVLLELAHRQLFPTHGERLVADVQAPGSLRRDGLLLSFDARSSWDTGDRFASDLVRDFAVARLLLRNGWNVLRDAGAPRWALRATRLACQASLARDHTHGETAREILQRDFDEIASHHGERWGELPWEALLTSGSPTDVLTRAWPTLTLDRGVELERLLRIALQRFASGTIADAEIVAPLVELLCAHPSEFTSFSHDLRERWDAAVLAWLRGLALRPKDEQPHPTRQRVREVTLARYSTSQTDELLESLALLGSDLDARVDAVLRRVAVDRPAFLGPCVETVVAPISLCRHVPQLLLALADAYYIERPRPEARWFESADPLNDGIRDHHGHSFGTPMVSWMHGPFWTLLRAIPVDALSLINRMLDHAAGLRVRMQSDESPPAATERLNRVEVDLPGVGRRRYVGDDHTWSWYRGSSVGPYPCMSALLAVERFADQVVASGVSLRRMSQYLLADCNNLAMAGLVVGLLVRHIEKVTNELDPWLAVPEVWDFEFARVMREGTIHVQGPDALDVPGRDQRRVSFRDVAGHLVTNSLSRKDRLDELDRIAQQLVLQAETKIGRSGSEHDEEAQKWLLSVRGWASVLQAQHFQPIQLGGDVVGIAYNPPQEVAQGLAADNARLGRIMGAYELLNRHVAEDKILTADLAQMENDIRIAQSLIDDPPTQERAIVLDAPTATATAALQAHARGLVVLRPDAINWAVEVVLAVGLGPEDAGRYSGEKFALGADRSAARAVPLLLLPCFNENAGSARLSPGLYARVRDALTHMAASRIDEIRREIVTTLAYLWQAPCTPGQGGTPECRHAEALAAVVSAARLCRLAPFDYDAQRRPEAPLEGPMVESLHDLPAADILVPRLTGPIIAAADCLRFRCCVAGDATPLLQALLVAHRRGAAHWADKLYHADNDDRRSVAEVLLKLVGSGQDRELIQHVDLFVGHPHALEQLLTDLAQLATYDEAHRSALRAIWPQVMDQVLNAYDAAEGKRQDRSSARAVAALVPAPQLSVADRDPEATLTAARVGWPTPGELASRVERWLALPTRDGSRVDALVGLLNVAAIPEQARRGLPWILRLVENRFEIAHASFRLSSWLRRLRDAGVLDATTRPAYERIVDGWAASGDHRAVELQQLDE